MMPDKIYIPQNISRSDVTSLSFLDDKGRGIEYIRKGALLEWLDGKLTIEGATEGYVGGYDSALKDVIDKLNEM